MPILGLIVLKLGMPTQADAGPPSRRQAVSLGCLHRQCFWLRHGLLDLAGPRMLYR
jgi:hypothetical protein